MMDDLFIDRISPFTFNDPDHISHLHILVLIELDPFIHFNVSEGKVIRASIARGG